MPEIIIPKRLNDRLSLDDTWQPLVTTLKGIVQKIIKESPYFFPDYTDHGIDHINEVLTLANRLIPEDTYACMVTDTEYLLDPRSVGFLVCAILVHDLGMFLKTDGMEQLVYGDYGSHLVEGLDEEDWRTSWSKYVVKTRRLKDNEMDHLFGHRVTISEDCARKGFSTNGDDRRVIGEFLRQNHGRLAHEIAVHGFPGDKKAMLITGDSITDEDRDMIGLLARSHQMNIRDTEEYIERFGEGSKPHSIPAFYLMTVLRMADYLDASEKRAPEILERIQKIRVPASETEWSWNQRITKGPKQWDLKKHNLEINATPQKSTEYVLLDNWLRSVQSELDLCWSILADQYSGEPYRLTIHRIISNIQQKKSQEKLNEKFLTKEAKISANPAIVKLMMAPLYGDDPTYGVRELLQNAVDACLEREQWEKTNKEGNPNYKGLVDIRIENGVFTITDNGMGMNEDILLNYYLSAGSSYRSSDAWMAANAPDGKSQVARTGKFGVGFLASFLLGEKIEVLTQYREDKIGYHFTFSQESTTLDVDRRQRFNPYAAKVDAPKHSGTTITIKLKAGVYERLQKDLQEKHHTWYRWYAWDDPIVNYHFDGASISSPDSKIPRIPDKHFPWFRLVSQEFENYYWSFRESDKFFCNGIYIPHYQQQLGFNYGFSFNAPAVSVTDPNASLNVDLQRNHVLVFPEEKKLAEELYRYIIAGLLVSKWDYARGCRIFTGNQFPCLQRPNGFLPNHPAFRSAANITRFLALCLSNDIPYGCGYAEPILPSFMTDDVSFMILSPNSYFGRFLITDFIHQIPYLMDPMIDKHHTDTYLDYQSIGIRFWLSKEAYACLHNGRYYARPLDSFLRESDAVSEDSMLKWSLADLPLDSPLLEKAAEKENGLRKCYTPEDLEKLRAKYSVFQMPIDISKYPHQKYAFAIDCLTCDPTPSQSSLFTELLFRYLGPDLWIPYDLKDRKIKFSNAFKELKPYIDYIEAHPYG